MARSKTTMSRKNVTALSGPQLPVEEPKRKTLHFDYIKSNYFRVIHVDGAHGSPTPKGDGIQIALFSERNPIPKREEYDLSGEGQLAERIDSKTVVRDAVVREVEVEAILSVEVAKRLEAWLHDKIAFLENLHSKGR